MDLICQFVLASASPRRKQLLEQLGLAFKVHPSHVDETYNTKDSPPSIVKGLAKRKAHAIEHLYPESLILAADTIVVIEEEILGKPANQVEARTMLHRLSNSQHTVYTGIALSHPLSGRTVTSSEATEVTFSKLEESEIEAYIATRSPFDKAGGYGIQDDQGALYISGIQGDYYNVVGLPLHKFYQMLKTYFDDLLII